MQYSLRCGKNEYIDPTNAHRTINVEFATGPDFRRLRSLSKSQDKFNRPPFVAKKGDNQPHTLANWRDLLAFAREEGMKDVNIQRYKGLGEMNAEQLWETTMNPEKRTLLSVELKDLVEADQIFSTLMGEDVEQRRKFIEDNALDVRNLDI